MDLPLMKAAFRIFAICRWYKKALHYFSETKDATP